MSSPASSADGHAPAAGRRELSLLHGELYDLKPFEHAHPGGKDMLRLAYGRDATELFESVHALYDRAQLARVLARYRVERSAVHPADVPRPSTAPAFSWDAPSPFAVELRAEVRAHFAAEAERRGVSFRQASKATPAKWALIGVLTGLYALSAAAWYAGRWWSLLALPLFGSMATFNVFHDGSHGALATSPALNTLGSVMGFSIAAPYNWAHQHVIGHHAHTNIPEHDPDYAHVHRWRTVPTWAARLLLPLLWALAVPLGLHLMAPARLLFTGAYNYTVSSIPLSRLDRAEYVARWLGLLLLSYGWPFVAMPFGKALVWAAVPAAVSSVTFMVITQIAHLTPACAESAEAAVLARLPPYAKLAAAGARTAGRGADADGDGDADGSDGADADGDGSDVGETASTASSESGGSDSLSSASSDASASQLDLQAASATAAPPPVCFFEHQLRTAADYAVESEAVYYFSGGLNLQVAHHMFPTINHCHLRAVQRIIARVALSHGLAYHSIPSVSKGLALHWQFVTQLRHGALQDAAKLEAAQAAAAAVPPLAAGARAAGEPRSCVYVGNVWHARARVDGSSSEAAAHRFEVAMPWACLDLDELGAGELPVSPALLCVDGSRWAPLSFRSSDHLRSLPARAADADADADAPVAEAPAAALARRVRALIGAQSPGGVAPAGRVQLVTQLRHWGYTFNPISIYYLLADGADDADGARGAGALLRGEAAGPALLGAVLEVSNTPWDEEHVYVVAGADTLSRPFELAKAFHVSPFNPMAQTMRWRLHAPAAALKMHVELLDHARAGAAGAAGGGGLGGCPALCAADGARVFGAGVCMAERRPLTAETARWLLRSYPLLPQRVQWRIHVQAARLFLKGVRFHPHPLGTTTAASRAVSALVNRGPPLVGGAAAAAAAALLALPGCTPLTPAAARLAAAACALLAGLAAAAAAKTRAIKQAAGAGGATTTAAPAAAGSGAARGASARAPSNAGLPTPGALGAQPAAFDGSAAAWAPRGAAGIAAATVGAPSAGGRKRVAIVGSGIAGHSAAYYMRAAHDITLLEADEARAGGHAYSLAVCEGATVDVGFQVMNLSNYPLLTRLFDELGVLTIASDMTLAASISPAGGGAPFEWSSKAPFPSQGSLLDPGRWRLFAGILTFEREARAYLASAAAPGAAAPDESVRAWLDGRGYSASFRARYFYPMVASIWSAPKEGVDGFAMRAVLAFLDNHFMLQRTRPRWRTPKHRSADYVRRLHAALPAGCVRMGARVAALRADPATGELALLDGEGRELAGGARFDAVVLACHARDSLAILDAPATALPAAARAALVGALSRFDSTANEVVVHSDVAAMPRDRRCWAAWNYLATDHATASGAAAVTVSYYANALQAVRGPAGAEHLFVTLNPPAGLVAPSRVLKAVTMYHPCLSTQAVAARAALGAAQGSAGVYCAGAWVENGFHEDGVRSALAVARLLHVAVADAPAAPSPELHWLTRRLVVPLLARGLASLFKAGSARLILPSGDEVVLGDGGRCGPREGEALPMGFGESNNGSWPGCEEVAVRVLHERGLWRMLADPGMGLSEAYIEGEVVIAPDLIDLFRAGLWNAARSPALDSPLAVSVAKLSVARLWNRLLYTLSPNSLGDGSLKNISAHYDLSNQMFQAFLDPTMTYSSGIYTDKYAVSPYADPAVEYAALHAAQFAKLDRMADLVRVRPSDTVLEIGFGWGSMAIRTVGRFGCKWVGLTLSVEQLEEATARVAAAGLQDKITLLLLDYRDVVKRYGAGHFDKVVSVEMIEAVGHEFMPEYFQVIADALRPGGEASIQAICVPDSRYESYRRGSDYIRKHIFPGSHLPCPGVIEQCATRAGLDGDAAGTMSLALSYAKTLQVWRARFADQLGTISALRAAQSVTASTGGGVSSSGEFDAAFARKFDYYFAYCEAGFAARHIDVLQLRFTKPAAGLAARPRASSRDYYERDALEIASALLGLALAPLKLARALAGVLYALLVGRDKAKRA